jgi:hypothetical protein
MNRSAAVAILLALAAAGCGGSKPSPPPAEDPAPAAASLPGGAFGVPECDRFAVKYLACLDKVPEGGRAMARQAFDQTIEHWRLVAGNPERRESLAAACAQQEKATRAAMERYDCDW